MRARIGEWNVVGLFRLVDIHREKLSRSRTYVNSAKAVRLDDHSMRNATIRLEGDRYIVRYHRTDILSFTGPVAKLHIDGWNTMSTYDRVYTATGVILRSGGSRNESVHDIRIGTGGQHTIPYFEGIEVNTNTGDILNPEEVPIDIRRRTMKITKEGAAKFRKLWAPVNDRLVREIKLGNTLENMQNRATIQAFGYNFDKVVEGDTPNEYVEAALRRHCRNYKLGRPEPEPTEELLAGVKKLRVSVQHEWATNNGYMEDIGGSVLTGPKYYGGVE